ncbi:MAG: helix-turn-helix domain-containing protein [Ruminococcaceae bacterium]|nr:helix-turn-helix domain-containing protein [Oscillospiraceae bacterium]
MVSVFNIEQLQGLLKDFYRIAGIRITVFDSNLAELVSYPENCAPFCQLIRSTPEGRRACAECDRAACAAASRRASAYIYRCHAGLTEAIMPLWVDNALVGYLFFGHIFAYESEDAGWRVIQECCANYPVDPEDLRRALKDCPQVTDEYILSAAQILHATASFLVMQRMATLQEGTLASKLDAYIRAHFCEDISAASLCREFFIGRSKLYKLSNQLYGCGIAEHIRALRLEKAKRLLLEHRQMRIVDVAMQCGFTDYNYFIAVFSAHVGLSPGAYRRKQ